MLYYRKKMKERKDSVFCTYAKGSAANAVKHAGGDEITVSFSDGGFVITNNGEAPKKPIEESGGLLSLRRLVEEEGGEMSVTGDPVFSLTVRF